MWGYAPRGALSPGANAKNGRGIGPASFRGRVRGKSCDQLHHSGSEARSQTWSMSLGLPAVAPGVTLLSMKRVPAKSDDQMPAEIDDGWASLIATFSRLI